MKVLEKINGDYINYLPLVRFHDEDITAHTKLYIYKYQVWNNVAMPVRRMACRDQKINETY